MRKFSEWLLVREEAKVTKNDKCAKCGATGGTKASYTTFSNVNGKTYCDACARQLRREENK